MNSSPSLDTVNNASMVTGFDQVASKLFMPTFIILSYFACLLIGFKNFQYLSESPLVRIASNIFGPCSASLCGSFAYVIAFIVPHTYGFAKDVFGLSNHIEFRISITMAFILL